MKKLIMFVLVAVIVGVVIASFSGGDNSGGGGGGGDSGGDASAELACTHFRDVARDYSSGVLTLEELRGKLQEVDSNAKISSSPGIAQWSQSMLADLTQGNIGRPLRKSIGKFADACAAAGF